MRTSYILFVADVFTASTPTASNSLSPGLQRHVATLGNLAKKLITLKGLNTPNFSSRQGHMPQSLDQIYLHIVFSTKHRHPFLQDIEVRQELWANLVGIGANLKCPPIQVGGWYDHVHILCKLSRIISVSDLVRELKRSSSEWIKERFSNLPDFYWQAGYGVFSACPSILDALIHYIQNQAEHHGTLTYQDEFRQLCKKYHVAIDERYCWD